MVGVRPTCQQLTQMGRVTARLHQQSKDWRPSGGATLPRIDGILMNSPDNLSLGDGERMAPVLYQLLAVAMAVSVPVYTQLGHRFAIQPIHADIHPCNLMWQAGQLSVFDFDDAGLGCPIQDLAVTCYYLCDIGGAEA